MGKKKNQKGLTVCFPRWIEVRDAKRGLNFMMTHVTYTNGVKCTVIQGEKLIEEVYLTPKQVIKRLRKIRDKYKLIAEGTRIYLQRREGLWHEVEVQSETKQATELVL